MNIVFVNNYAYLRGGSERVMFDEMRLLATHGISTSLFSRQHPENNNWPTAPDLPTHLEYDTPGLFNKIYAAKELIYSNTVASSLRKHIAHEQPDLIHGHNIYGRLTTAALDAAHDLGTPSVMTLHDYKLICPSYLLMRNDHVCVLCAKGNAFYCLLKRCHKGSFIASTVYVAEAYFTRLFKKYHNVRFFICPSRFLLEIHKQNGIAAEKLVYVPNAINVAGFTPQYEGGGYALFAGRLSREKGVQTLLKAIQHLDIPLKIVGSGPLQTEFKTLAQDQNLKNITFEGYRSGEQLETLFQNAAFLVFPSEWYENAPMTILEAYGYGKPVIGANIGGIPEMIVDGETGLLFPPGDAENLREKINQLWSNPARTAAMGKNARRRVEQMYNSELHYDLLMAVYQRAMH